jgi:predicted secreted hydrolase
MTARDVLMAAGVALSALGASCADAAAQLDVGWTSASPEYAWSFPRDHYAHPGFKTEWWYITGIVGDDRGREFGY